MFAPREALGAWRWGVGGVGAGGGAAGPREKDEILEKQPRKYRRGHELLCTELALGEEIQTASSERQGDTSTDHPSK